MNILIVTEDFPWPSRGGGLIRLAKAIEAVSGVGHTDLFSLYDPNRTDPVLPPHVDIERLETVCYPGTPDDRRWRTRWLSHRGVPMEVAMRSFDHAPRLSFERWTADHYDLVWFSTAATYSWMGRPRLGPTIIDLMDLEDVKARQRARLLRGRRGGRSWSTTIRDIGASAQVQINARDWTRFQKSVASDVDRVVLCSDVDVLRSGIANAAVVPNTFARPEESMGHGRVGTPPVILFQGSLHYGPNMDAVDWLVDQVAPHLWTRMPEAQIRLVGTTSTSVARRHRPPAITVTGRVPEMEPELARADIAVVPLRIGSGTRLKILESFAHRVPVVSTTLGAEGIDVTNNVHLLLADDAESFAAACQRLLVDEALRKRLVDSAEELYLSRYEWSAARDRIRALVHEVAHIRQGT
ncbi:MAG: glycosyltransferase [Acidimicrobiales bacterium]